jgi:hypothetical protein
MINTFVEIESRLAEQAPLVSEEAERSRNDDMVDVFELLIVRAVAEVQGTYLTNEITASMKDVLHHDLVFGVPKALTKYSNLFEIITPNTTEVQRRQQDQLQTAFCKNLGHSTARTVARTRVRLMFDQYMVDELQSASSSSSWLGDDLSDLPVSEFDVDDEIQRIKALFSAQLRILSTYRADRRNYLFCLFRGVMLHMSDTLYRAYHVEHDEDEKNSSGVISRQVGRFTSVLNTYNTRITEGA